MSVKSRLKSEQGFTMAITVAGMFLVTLLALAAVTAVEGDIHLTRNDLDHKQAYEAAKAGIDDYSFHLNKDTSYWTKCTAVPAPSAVNQQGSTANRRPVPGSTEETYAIELIPATGQSTCETANPVTSMIETNGQLPGSFRIRSTGYAGTTHVSVVATFKKASFLDYMYFTQLETSDPVTYGYANPSEALDGRLQTVHPDLAARTLRTTRSPDSTPKPKGLLQQNLVHQRRLDRTGRCIPMTGWRSAASRTSAERPPT